MPYAALTTLKAYLGVTGTGDDALLSRLLEASTAAIDAHCRRTFAASTATLRHRSYLWLGREIVLRDDLRALTSITSDTGDTLTPADVIVVVPARVILLKPDAPMFSALDWFDVEGTWGYTATPPADIEQACVRMAAWMYRQKDAQTLDLSGMTNAGQITAPSRMPGDIAQMLAPYVVPSVVVP